MATAYTSLLGLALPVTGELSGSWGDIVNDSITSLLDSAVAGTTSLTTDTDVTLTSGTGAANQARQAIILWNPASGTVTRNITAPAQSKIYSVINASGGTQSIVFRGAGPTTGVTIIKGESAVVAWNGSDFVKISSSGGSPAFVDLTVTGNTILGDTAGDTLTVNATSTFNAPVSFAGQVKLPSAGRSAAAALTPTNPAFLYGVASTYTDTTSSGTLAPVASFYGLAQPTLSTSNVTTYTTAATLYIANAPAASGSATITNSYALYSAAGANYFGGSITLNGGTANSVAYLNGSKDLTTGSALTFDGSTFDVNGTINGYVIGPQGLADNAAAPGIYVYNDPDTGFFRPASNNIGFAVGGAEAMRLTSTGLGIGTSSPSVALDVSGVASAGTVRATTSFQLVDSLSSARNVMQLAADDLTIQTGTSAGARSIYFLTEGLERLRIDSSGNVGIGTSSPTNALSVTGSANITGNTTLGDATTDTVTVSGYMGVGGAGNSSFGINLTSSALTGSNQYGIFVNPTASSSATTSVRGISVTPATAATAFTAGLVTSFYANNATLGAGSTITNLHGLYIADQTQGTNNYGITSLVSSGTNKWNIYASGTAANYMAGQLQLGDGSAAAPALSNFGDENTGIFFPAADTIAFAEGGAEVMRITSAGKLLVGDSSAPSISASFMGGGGSVASIAALGSATTPIQISSFSGTAGYAGYLAFTRGKGTDSSDASVPVADGNRLGSMVFFGADGTDFTSDAAYITATVDGAVATGSVPGALSFFTNAAGSSTPTERLRIDSSGNVGIGTSSPLARLNTYQVNGGGEAATLFQNFSTTTNTTVALYLSPTNGSLTTGSIRAGFIKAINVGSGVTALTFGTNSSGADPTEKMRIDSSGNVGIGTSSPVGNLDVAGTAPTLNIRDTQSKTWVAGDTVGTLDFYSNDTSGVGAQAVSRIRSVADIASAAPTGALAFWTAAAGSAATEKLRITSAGDVGIGTSTPGALLDVAASGGATIDIRNSATSSTTNDLVGALDFISSDNSSSQGGLPRGYIRTYIAESLGTGGYMTFGTAATGSGGIAERLRIDSSGNLGLGVTPSAWLSSYNVFQAGIGASFTGRTSDRTQAAMAANLYVSTSGTNTYIGTGAATRYMQYAGEHQWFNAASGTADAAITFTQAMTLDAIGDLGIGTTSPTQRLDVSMLNSGASGTVAVFRNAGTSTVNTAARIVLTSRSGDEIRGSYIEAINVGGANYPFDLVFGTSSSNATPTERMRIDNSGNVQTSTGAQVVWAPAPASISTTATLTNANIQGQIINTTGTSYTVTMPLGTTLETLVPWATTNLGYDFTVINTASGTITMAINTGVTSLGGLTIATGTSAQFRIRRTATNTFVLYRMR